MDSRLAAPHPAIKVTSGAKAHLFFARIGTRNAHTLM